MALTYRRHVSCEVFWKRKRYKRLGRTTRTQRTVRREKWWQSYVGVFLIFTHVHPFKAPTESELVVKASYRLTQHNRWVQLTCQQLQIDVTANNRTSPSISTNIEGKGEGYLLSE